jgi:TonB family protein
MNKNLVRLCVITAVVVSTFSGMAQESKPAPPSVAAAAVPLYPPLARMARIEGVVHVKITTDGHKVVDAQVEDGHKMLAAAAETNVRTWEFSNHDPTTFTVTYQYKLVDDLKENPYGPTVILRLPKEVEVLAMPVIISDPPAELTPAKPTKKKSDTTLLHERLARSGLQK